VAVVSNDKELEGAGSSGRIAGKEGLLGTHALLLQEQAWHASDSATNAAART
jgi:hypothetical protein